MVGQRVRVHFNLHRHDWSVSQKGRVVLNADSITLENVRFIVSESGWRRSQTLGKRTVHAWAEGTVVAVNEPAPNECTKRVRYNPFRAGFFHTDEGTQANGATLAHFATVGQGKEKRGYTYVGN